MQMIILIQGKKKSLSLCFGNRLKFYFWDTNTKIHSVYVTYEQLLNFHIFISQTIILIILEPASKYMKLCLR